MGAEGEVLEKFALGFKRLQEAVAAVEDFLGMQTCDGTGRSVSCSVSVSVSFVVSVSFSVSVFIFSFIFVSAGERWLPPLCCTRYTVCSVNMWSCWVIEPELRCTRYTVCST